MSEVEQEERPFPVQVQMCSACGEFWDDHLYQVSYMDEDEEDGVGHLEVTLLQCIEVLKNKHRGPSGFPGPTGPMGAMGTVDFDSVAVRGYVEKIVRDTITLWSVGQ
jgi:hypothetical protein